MFIRAFMYASIAVTLIVSCGKKSGLQANRGETAPPVPKPAEIVPLVCESLAPSTEAQLFIDEAGRPIAGFTPPTLQFTVRLRRGTAPVLEGKLLDWKSGTGGLASVLPPQAGNNGNFTAFIRATALGPQTIDFLVADKNGEQAQCSSSIQIVGRRPDPLQVVFLANGGTSPLTIPKDERVTLSVLAPLAKSCELFRGNMSLGAFPRSGERVLDPHANLGAVPIEHTYSVTCVAEGSPATQSASVRVTVNPAPTVSMAITSEGIGRRDAILAFLRPDRGFRVEWRSQFAAPNGCRLKSNGAMEGVSATGARDFIPLQSPLDLVFECVDGKAGLAQTEARLRLPVVPSVRINGLGATVSKSVLPSSVSITWDGTGTDSCQFMNRSLGGITGNITVNRDILNSNERFEVRCVTAGVESSSSVQLAVDCDSNELVALRKSHYLQARTLPVKNAAGKHPRWTHQGYHEYLNINYVKDGDENATPALSGLRAGDRVSITSIAGVASYLANVSPYDRACTEKAFYNSTLSEGSVSAVQFVGVNGRPVAVSSPLPKYFGRDDDDHFRVDSLTLLNARYAVPSGAVALHSSFVDTIYGDNANGCTFGFAVYGCRDNAY